MAAPIAIVAMLLFSAVWYTANAPQIPVHFGINGNPDPVR